MLRGPLINTAFATILILASPLPAAKVAIGPGERLYYRAHWRNFTGGYARLEIVRRVKKRGTDTYFLRMLVRSTKWMDSFYKIRYDVRSYWDFKRLRPLEGDKRIQQGFSERFYTMTFDWRRRTVRYSVRKYSANTGIFGQKRKGARWRTRKGAFKNLPAGTQDLLSALYFMRLHHTQPKVGTKFVIRVYDDAVLRKINVQIENRETIVTPLGTFKTIRVTTDFNTKGILRSKGKIRAWVTDDEYRIPVQIKAGIPILGDVQVDLVRIIKSK